MQKLFFELIQVALGQLDCLERGPAPEEWEDMFHLSQRHGLTALTYDGVVRLFEYGLRAPQDVSIDWMAATETDAVAVTFEEPLLSNGLRRMLYIRWKDRCGTSLYRYKGADRQFTPETRIVMQLLQAFEDFHHGTLTLRTAVDMFQVLHNAEHPLSNFGDGSSVSQMLQTFGIWRFSCAMMWVVNKVTALDVNKMACPPDGSGGSFLLDQLMSVGEKRPLVDSLKTRIKIFLKF